jgi:hypothetical protein
MSTGGLKTGIATEIAGSSTAACNRASICRRTSSSIVSYSSTQR